MRIALCYQVEPRHVDQIRAAAPWAEVINAGPEGIAEAILEADIFGGHAKVPMPWDEVVRQGRLKWIQSSAAGLDHCLVPSVVESEIIVTGSSGLFANQVAEQTLALLLGLLRSLPVFFRAQQQREFIRRPTRDLHHATVGILGFGGNGRRLAELLAPFQTRLLATDMFPVDKPDYVERLWPVERTDELLSQVDIAILCVPLTEFTHHMIGREQLALMKPGSLLVNVARGPVVAEDALVEALTTGHLAGAGLDVTEVEPLAETSLLWDHPAVIITPHVGAQSARRIDDATNRFCENLQRYHAGQPLINQVDKRLGYAVRTGPPAD